MKKRVVILGGGITAIAIASIFREEYDVMILESQDEIFYDPMKNNYPVFSFQKMDVPGITWTEIQVKNTIDGMPPSPEGIERYKEKCGRKGEVWKYNWFLESHQGFKIINYDKSLRDLVKFKHAVTGVNLFDKVIYCGRINKAYPYDICINTLPAIYFQKCVLPQEYAEDVTDPIELLYNPLYIRTEILNFVPFPNKEFHMATVTDPDVAWFRQAYWENRCVYESMIPITEDDLNAQITAGRISISECKKLVPGKVIDNNSWNNLMNVWEEDHIYHVGRYARHESYGRIEFAIQKAMTVYVKL